MEIVSGKKMTDNCEDEMSVFVRVAKKANAERLKMAQLLNESSMKLVKLISDAPESKQSEVIDLFSKRQSKALRDMRMLTTTKDFDLISPLGTGSFGRVFLVTDKLHQQTLAVKQVSKSKAGAHPASVARLFAELDILSRINTPQIIKLYSTFQDSDYLYMVMEYLEGGDLCNYLQKVGKLDLPSVQYLASQLLVALKAIHKLGFIHRDVKPANIGFSKSGQVKLFDFGICRHQDAHGHASSRIGTPAYFAPEVLECSYSYSADVWSVGVVLFECLTGRALFSAPTNSETFKLVINHAQVVSSSINYAPQASWSFLLKMLCDCSSRASLAELEKDEFVLNVTPLVLGACNPRFPTRGVPFPGNDESDDLLFAGYDFRSVRDLAPADKDVELMVKKICN